MFSIQNIISAIRARGEYRRRALTASDSWLDTTETCEDEAIFLGGGDPSSVSHLRNMLARHGDISCCPNTLLFAERFDAEAIADSWQLEPSYIDQLRSQSGSAARFVRLLIHDHLQQTGAARWTEASAANVRNIPDLLRLFPNARFIHVVRDFRDAICEELLSRSIQASGSDGSEIESAPSIAPTADRWAKDTSAGLAYQNHPRCIEVRYERLLSDSEAELRRVCTFLNEPFEPEMLNAFAEPMLEGSPFLKLRLHGRSLSPRTPHCGRWCSDLPAEHRRVVGPIVGELLIALGYAQNHDWANSTDSKQPRLRLVRDDEDSHRVA